MLGKIALSLSIAAWFSQVANAALPYFHAKDPHTIKAKPNVQSTRYRVFHVNLAQLTRDLLASEKTGTTNKHPVTLTLPFPEGDNKVFIVSPNNLLPKMLAKRYPRIHAFDAVAKNNPALHAKLDITPQGFHAFIMESGTSPIYIDPWSRTDHNDYIVYRQRSLVSKKRLNCHVKTPDPHVFIPVYSYGNQYAACKLHTYRLALAATAEYTTSQGGTKEDALAAETTTINRVNGIYENELGVTFQFVPDNDNVIYTDDANQPYTSGNLSALIDQNQTNLDLVIGSANYDIGHLFDASDIGGAAAFASVCSKTSKASAVTASATPTGDPFDVDYVAHEFGHQFGATHVQNNNCNRYELTAVEPGSGSTIMSYAGLCAPNVQTSVDAYFNGINLQQMGAFLDGAGSACGTLSDIDDAPSLIKPDDIVVPVGTPFFLTAKLSHANNAVTYDWEQIDNQVSQQPPQHTAAGGPNFRSMKPAISPTRYFPSLTLLSELGPYTWEALPTVARTMHFRITARSNASEGACNAYQNVTVTMPSNTGPMFTMYPTEDYLQWQQGSTQYVTWAVGNTDQPPISDKTVDVLLSTDAGETYPTHLADNVPNTGLLQLTVPSNITTSTARIMVKGHTSPFFSVSAYNFVIAPKAFSGPFIESTQRNPMDKTTLFLYYKTLNSVQVGDTFKLNQLSSATVTLDTARRRFIVKHFNVTTPAYISIRAEHEGLESNSNLVLIGGIL